jgi:hypothetical protein
MGARLLLIFVRPITLKFGDAAEISDGEKLMKLRKWLYAAALALAQCFAANRAEADLIAIANQISGGNGNGRIEPNECNLLVISLQNTGPGSATNISAVLTTTTPGLTISQPYSSYSDLATNGVAGNFPYFKVSTSPSFTCGTPITATLIVTYNGTSSAVIPVNLVGSGAGYTITSSLGASIVPGVLDIGLHADDGTTNISLPFVWSFYGTNFSTVTPDSNGNLQFASAYAADYFNLLCLPDDNFNYVISPFWADLTTSGPNLGVFVSTNGSSPNRIFNIEWRAQLIENNATVNFEVRLYEDQSRFDIVYGNLNGNVNNAAVGIQAGLGSYSTNYANYSCNSGGLTNYMQLTFQQICVPSTTGPCSGPPPQPSLGASHSGTNMLLSFATVPGSSYVLQYKNFLTNSTWLNLQTNVGNGLFQTVTNSTVSPAQRYYRLNVTTP